jgi:O-antigen/teichoic acid export membrane protein
VLTRISTGSLFWLGCVTSFSTVVVPLAANIWLFSRRYRRYAPSFRFVRFGQARQLMSLGVQFFLLQIAGVVIFATSNLVITQIFGASEVVPYNIAFKYYGLASMAFTVLLTPFWSAFTDAHTRGDTRWIAMTMRKLKMAWAVLACGVLGMTVVANVAYALWVGPSVHVPLLLSASMAAYVLIVAWSTIFAYFINGTGKIRLQLFVALSTALAVIPLAILFSTRLELGTAGVMLAVCVALLPGCFLWPIQAKKIIEHRATGIWAR